MLSSSLLLLLMGTFAASCVGKIAFWQGTVSWFQSLWPRQPATALASTAVSVELLTLFALATWPKWGALMAFIWMVLASAVLFAVRRNVKTCGCFGRLRRLSKWTTLRNAAIAALSMATFLLTRADHMSGSMLPTGLALGAMAVVYMEVGALGERL